jgi:HSP20 family protein
MANRELTPWSRGTALSPFGGREPFGSFRREIDRLFDDFFAPVEARSFGTAPQGATAVFWPTIDVDETEQAYIVTAEMAGIDPKDVELNFNDNALVISGHKQSERKEEEAGRRYSERSFGRFERTIPFGTDIDLEKVEASSHHGVLTITLPKSAQARNKSRRIEIKPKTGPQARGAGASGSGGQ